MFDSVPYEIHLRDFITLFIYLFILRTLSSMQEKLWYEYITSWLSILPMNFGILENICKLQASSQTFHNAAGHVVSYQFQLLIKLVRDATEILLWQIE